MPELTASDSEADDGVPHSEDRATSTKPTSSSEPAAVVEAPATHATPPRRLRRGFSTFFALDEDGLPVLEAAEGEEKEEEGQSDDPTEEEEAGDGSAATPARTDAGTATPAPTDAGAETAASLDKDAAQPTAKKRRQLAPWNTDEDYLFKEALTAGWLPGTNRQSNEEVRRQRAGLPTAAAASSAKQGEQQTEQRSRASAAAGKGGTKTRAARSGKPSGSNRTTTGAASGDKPDGKRAEAVATATEPAPAVEPRTPIAQPGLALWERFRMTKAAKPPRSYIQGWSIEKQQWVLIVQCTAARSDRHETIIRDLLVEIQADATMTKERAVERRDSLLAAQAFAQ